MRQMFAKDVPLCLIQADFLCRQLSPFMFNCRLRCRQILHMLNVLCYSSTIQKLQFKSYTVSLHKHGVIEIVEMNIYGTNCEGEMTCKSCIRGWDQRKVAEGRIRGKDGRRVGERVRGGAERQVMKTQINKQTRWIKRETKNTTNK